MQLRVNSIFFSILCSSNLVLRASREADKKFKLLGCSLYFLTQYLHLNKILTQLISILIFGSCTLDQCFSARGHMPFPSPWVPRIFQGSTGEKTINSMRPGDHSVGGGPQEGNKFRKWAMIKLRNMMWASVSYKTILGDCCLFVLEIKSLLLFRVLNRLFFFRNPLYFNKSNSELAMGKTNGKR